MPTSAELTDACLAQLLEKEANDRSSGVSRRSDRPRDAPKPNVRFLRTIIKETDSHNAVLIEREKRLAALNSRRPYDHTRPRREIEPAAKRQRVERPDRWKSVLGQTSVRGKREESDTQRDHTDRDGRKRDSRDDRRRCSRSPRRDERPRSHSHRREKRPLQRSLSPRRSRSRSPRRRYHSPHHKTHKDDSYDSDPLEAIVGPMPASKQKTRGRGATADSSGIDSRFTDPNYDPSKDIQPTEDDDDWTMALTALQDRQKWQAMNADRLRAAGFSEDEVRKWESTSNITPRAERDVEDVRWSKKGEARDWDLGKTIDADGDVVTKAPWADA